MKHQKINPLSIIQREDNFFMICIKNAFFTFRNKMASCNQCSKLISLSKSISKTYNQLLITLDAYQLNYFYIKFKISPIFSMDNYTRY